MDDEDYRRCRHCDSLFLVGHRPTQVYCSESCAEQGRWEEQHPDYWRRRREEEACRHGK